MCLAARPPSRPSGCAPKPGLGCHRQRSADQAAEVANIPTVRKRVLINLQRVRAAHFLAHSCLGVAGRAALSLSGPSLTQPRAVPPSHAHTLLVPPNTFVPACHFSEVLISHCLVWFHMVLHWSGGKFDGSVVKPGPPLGNILCVCPTAPQISDPVLFSRMLPGDHRRGPRYHKIQNDQEQGRLLGPHGSINFHSRTCKNWHS